MAKPKGYKSVKVNGNEYPFTVTDNEDGTVTVLAMGVMPFTAKDADAARETLRVIFTQWDVIRGQK